MKIKHSKYRNTGLIFELLVKQIASDTLSRKDSPAVKLLKKYFTGNTALVREFKLYELILKNKGVNQSKAESIISTVTEISRKLDRATLKSQKYNLIKDLKEHYSLDEFFSMKVRDYKPLAALYCLMEGQNVEDLVTPQFLVDNKITILEHLTSSKQNEQEVKDSLVEEFSKYDKDLRMLTYKILLEKFNKAYNHFTDKQKTLLGKFITEGASENRLRDIVNNELVEVVTELSNIKRGVKDDVLRIKLNEVIKAVTLVEKTKKVSNDNLVTLLQYYELINELNRK